jgi:glutathione S-transferase
MDYIMSQLTLVIGNKNYSSWSLRPWIYLRHNSIKFKEKRVPLFVETTENELNKFNSDYKVPVLVDGDLIIWDSLSILEYVSEVYLNNEGWPKDQTARAVARSVCAEMHSSFYNVRNEMPMNCRKVFKSINLSVDAIHEIERIKFLWRKCRKEFGGSNKWLFGNYTIADAMFAPIVLRFKGYSVPLNGLEAEYIENVLQQSELIEWIKAGRAETEIINRYEVTT